MPGPDTYVIYGHGSFDSQSIASPIRLPAGVRLYFATGHIREIGDGKMVAAADSVLMGCYYTDTMGRPHWTTQQDIVGQFYDCYESAGQAVPDYILGDTAGLYDPAIHDYPSRSAVVIKNKTGVPMRLSTILNSPHWRGRNPTTNFVWCGCRAMNLRQTPALTGDVAAQVARRNAIVLDL